MTIDNLFSYLDRNSSLEIKDDIPDKHKCVMIIMLARYHVIKGYMVAEYVLRKGTFMKKPFYVITDQDGVLFRVNQKTFDVYWKNGKKPRLNLMEDSYTFVDGIVSGTPSERMLKEWSYWGLYIDEVPSKETPLYDFVSQLVGEGVQPSGGDKDFDSDSDRPYTNNYYVYSQGASPNEVERIYFVPDNYPVLFWPWGKKGKKEPKPISMDMSEAVKRLEKNEGQRIRGHDGEKLAYGTPQEFFNSIRDNVINYYPEKPVDWQIRKNGWVVFQFDYKTMVDEEGRVKLDEMKRGATSPTGETRPTVTSGTSPVVTNLGSLAIYDEPTIGCVAEAKGPRPTMEDAHTVAYLGNSITLWAVFDGHGGSDVANHLKTELPTMLYGELQQIDIDDQEAVKKAIKTAFLVIDQNIYNDDTMTSGATVIMTLRVKDTLYVVNLGDSRGLLINASEGGNILIETKDHKPYDERARIEKAGGFVMYGRVNGSLAVSRALGDNYLKGEKKYAGEDALVSPVPDIYTYELAGTDDYKLVLACDGLWDVMKNEEVRDDVMNGSTCQDLIDKAYKRDSRDNVTIMIVDI